MFLFVKKVIEKYGQVYRKNGLKFVISVENFTTQMFFTNLVAFMSAGAVVALVLAKNNAIEEWRRLMGPTNPAEAKETFPDSIRALFGKGSIFSPSSLAIIYSFKHFCLCYKLFISFYRLLKPKVCLLIKPSNDKILNFRQYA